MQLMSLSKGNTSLLRDIQILVQGHLILFDSNSQQLFELQLHSLQRIPVVLFN